MRVFDLLLDHSIKTYSKLFCSLALEKTQECIVTISVGIEWFEDYGLLEAFLA